MGHKVEVARRSGRIQVDGRGDDAFLEDVLDALDTLDWCEWTEAKRGLYLTAYPSYNITVTKEF